MSDTASLWLTVPEVAALMQVDPDTVRRMIADGELPTLPTSRCVVRIPRHAIDALATDTRARRKPRTRTQKKVA